jgi:hypothetical protein
MKVTFLATTITSKGRFERGDVVDFPEQEAKDLQRLTTVESPAPSVKKKKKKKDDV